MSIIEVSPEFANGINSRVFTQGLGAMNGTLPYPHWTPVLATDWAGSARITSFRLMKGTPITVPNSANVLARNSDTLVEWNNYYTQWTTTVNTNPVIINTPYTAATQSGTATWMWWFVKTWSGGYVSQNNANAFIHEAVGTVGGAGSGADVELTYPNIVSGVSYRILNLRLQLPTSWTY